MVVTGHQCFGSEEGRTGERSSDNCVMYRSSLTAEIYVTKLHLLNIIVNQNQTETPVTAEAVVQVLLATLQPSKILGVQLAIVFIID